MVTLIQQDLAHPAVSDPLARDDSPITWPAETYFSTMGRDRGTYDVMAPGGVPCSSDFSTMGRDRGTYDVMAPGGVPCSSDFSTMGRDRGTYDLMAPGGV